MVQAMSTPAHSLLTLSKGPLFLHLYQVIIIILCLKFKSSCSLSRTLNLFLEVSGILYFLRLFLNLPPLPPYPSQTLTSPAGRSLCLEVDLKICQLIFFLSFFFPFQYSWCQNVMICFAPVTEVFVFFYFPKKFTLFIFYFKFMFLFSSMENIGNQQH